MTLSAGVTDNPPVTIAVFVIGLAIFIVVMLNGRNR